MDDHIQHQRRNNRSRGNYQGSPHGQRFPAPVSGYLTHPGDFRPELQEPFYNVSSQGPGPMVPRFRSSLGPGPRVPRFHVPPPRPHLNFDGHGLLPTPMVPPPHSTSNKPPPLMSVNLGSSTRNNQRPPNQNNSKYRTQNRQQHNTNHQEEYQTNRTVDRRSSHDSGRKGLDDALTRLGNLAMSADGRVGGSCKDLRSMDYTEQGDSDGESEKEGNQRKRRGRRGGWNRKKNTDNEDNQTEDVSDTESVSSYRSNPTYSSQQDLSGNKDPKGNYRGRGGYRGGRGRDNAERGGRWRGRGNPERGRGGRGKGNEFKHDNHDEADGQSDFDADGKDFHSHVAEELGPFYNQGEESKNDQNVSKQRGRGGRVNRRGRWRGRGNANRGRGRRGPGNESPQDQQDDSASQVNSDVEDEEVQSVGSYENDLFGDQGNEEEIKTDQNVSEGNNKQRGRGGRGNRRNNYRGRYQQYRGRPGRGKVNHEDPVNKSHDESGDLSDGQDKDQSECRDDDIVSQNNQDSVQGEEINELISTKIYRGRGRNRGTRGRGSRGQHEESKRGNMGSNERIQKWTSQDSLGSDKASTGRGRTDSETSDIDFGIDENKVFSSLVRTFGGRDKYDEFITKSGLFPKEANADQWFRHHMRRFRIFEDKGKIHYISAFYRDATYCLDYAKLSARKDGCQNLEKCGYFHICKDFLTGSCNYKDQCKYSHSFSDEFNHKRKLKLGLEVFSDKEIGAIVLHRFPHVCANSLQDESCFTTCCPDLHICCKYLIGKCFRNSCNVGHSFGTRHNTWILKIFQMEEWPVKKEKFLRRVVVFPRLQDIDYSEKDKSSGQQKAKALIEEIKSPVETDIDHDKTAHELHTRKNRKFAVDVPPTEFISAVEPSTYNQPDLPTSELVLDDKERDPKSTGAIPKQKKVTAWENKDPVKVAQEKPKSDVPAKLLEDSASKMHLCSGFIEGNCKFNKCRELHTGTVKGPYIWQIKLFDKWVSFEPACNEELEMKYCQLEDSCDAIVNLEDMCCSTEVVFTHGQEMEATVCSMDDGSLLAVKNPVRRLSTKSYSKCIPDKNQGFCTQWRWYWKDDIGQWQLFEPDVFQYTLEKKYTGGQKTYLFSRSKYQFKYRIDFSSFQQTNLDTLKVRQMCRRPDSFVSPSDVLNKQFPKSFSLPPYSPVPFPEWIAWDYAHDFELVEINPTSEGYIKAVKQMYDTIDKTKLNIETIYRIQNSKLWREYDVKKKNMLEDRVKEGLDGSQMERMLFHGTDSIKTCEGICTNSFDFRVCGKNATVYGEGAYFATTAKYSNSYTRSKDGDDKRYMFLANVLVGSYTQGIKEHKRPPERTGHKLYDSCVNNTQNPEMFIVYDRNQCYPLYLIVYKYLDVLPVRPASIPFVPSYSSGYQRATVPPSSAQPIASPRSSVHPTSASSSSGVGTTFYTNPYQSSRNPYPSSGNPYQSSGNPYPSSYPSSTSSSPGSSAHSPLGARSTRSDIHSAQPPLQYPRQGATKTKSPEKSCSIQ